MLLLDSLYINNSGGKILLDYLVQKFEEEEIDVFYLFDKRVMSDYSEIPAERKIYLKASIRNRWQFYKKNKGRFSKIFCFGNMPPFTKQGCEVITYFHQPLYLKKIDKNLVLKKQVGLFLKKKLLYFLRNHTNKWWIQLPSIKLGLNKIYKINESHIYLKVFYPPVPEDNYNYKREKASFIYVSSGATHKNQKRLINSFCRFYDEENIGKLTLTISNEFPEILDIIKYKQKNGYPIINLGYINRSDLYKQYQTHQFLIFPSLAESLGLGILEAIENGCQVLGADLQYMHNVCTPSYVFDPIKEDEIYQAFKIAVQTDLPETKQKVFNQIEEIIQELK